MSNKSASISSVGLEEGDALELAEESSCSAGTTVLSRLERAALAYEAEASQIFTVLS
jgi:hypothetical protein